MATQLVTTSLASRLHSATATVSLASRSTLLAVAAAARRSALAQGYGSAAAGRRASRLLLGLQGAAPRRRAQANEGEAADPALAALVAAVAQVNEGLETALNASAAAPDGAASAAALSAAAVSVSRGVVVSGTSLAAAAASLGAGATSAAEFSARWAWRLS
jgi:hypothetical protein